MDGKLYTHCENCVEIENVWQWTLLGQCLERLSEGRVEQSEHTASTTIATLDRDMNRKHPASRTPWSVA